MLEISWCYYILFFFKTIKYWNVPQFFLTFYGRITNIPGFSSESYSDLSEVHSLSDGVILGQALTQLRCSVISGDPG